METNSRGGLEKKLYHKVAEIVEEFEKENDIYVNYLLLVSSTIDC